VPGLRCADGAGGRPDSDGCGGPDHPRAAVGGQAAEFVRVEDGEDVPDPAAADVQGDDPGLPAGPGDPHRRRAVHLDDLALPQPGDFALPQPGILGSPQPGVLGSAQPGVLGSAQPGVLASAQPGAAE
jgi:hypothetical protein